MLCELGASFVCVVRTNENREENIPARTCSIPFRSGFCAKALKESAPRQGSSPCVRVGVLALGEAGVRGYSLEFEVHSSQFEELRALPS